MFKLFNLKMELSKSKDFKFKELVVAKNKITLIFNEVLTSHEMIDNFIIKYLIRLDKVGLNSIENHLPDTNVLIIEDSEINKYLNMGFLIVVYKKNYAIEVKEKLSRGINTVNNELAIVGPKDSFTEVYNTNLGLIRRRIKSSKLIAKDISIGRLSNTKIGILYIESITNIELVNNIYKTISKIDIDAILDSSYLKEVLEENKSIFPTIISTERPDKASMALLEGKIVILTDTSPYALILPSFFIDLFHTVDDYYQKPNNITFIRIIRLIAFLIAILLPAVYIAVTTRNYDLVSLRSLLVLKAGRTFVPFPAYIEAMFMIIAFEILRESDFRMSATVGSAVSILGGLILGNAAVSAGIVSPIMIIIIAISSISGLVFNSFELINAIRIVKIVLLFLATFLGLYGIIIGLVILFDRLVSIKTFGYSYLSPFKPFIKSELRDTFIKKDNKIKLRNPLLTNNVIRGKIK